jgi:hypothetical protein
MRLVRCTCDDQLEICNCEYTDQYECKNESFGEERCENIDEFEMCKK